VSISADTCWTATAKCRASDDRHRDDVDSGDDDDDDDEDDEDDELMSGRLVLQLNLPSASV